MSTITCELCGKQTHIIKKHLTTDHHDGSDEPCTIEEYKTRFPDAPTLSAAAIKKMEQVRKQKAAASGSTATAASTGKQPLGALMGIGSVKGGSGKEIEVNVLDRDSLGDAAQFVPEVDPDYSPELATLKAVALGIEANLPTYLYGPPGVGKSTIFEQYCAHTNRPFTRVQHTINTEESHIVGSWIVKDGQTVWMHGPLPDAMIYGKAYLADEYDRGHSTVQSVYQAVLEGKPLVIKEADEANRIIHPHPNFRFVANGNTNGTGDELGLHPATLVQDAATFERFSVVAEVGYMSKDKETAMLRKRIGLSKTDASRVVDFCNRVREQFPHEMPLTIGPRVALGIAKIGAMRASLVDGVELAFANRLPAAKKEAAMQMAQRIFES